MAALVAMSCPDQLRSHLAIARTNGVTQEELIEVITRLAFYSGWPNAVTAITVAKKVFQKNQSLGEGRRPKILNRTATLVDLLAGRSTLIM